MRWESPGHANLIVPRVLGRWRRGGLRLLERIEELAKTPDVTVVIGSASEGDAAEASARRAEAGGLGPVRVARTASELVDDVRRGMAGAAVRGTLSSHDVIPLLLEGTTATSPERVAVMTDGNGDPLLLAPVGIDEGRDLAERLSLMQGAIRLMTALGEAPMVAVMSMGRSGDEGRGEAIAISARECEALKDAAESEGATATCVGIQIERAVEEGNVIIAPDGVTGNIIFRSLHFISGRPSLGAVAIGVFPMVYVDTSRGKRDYVGAVKLARAVSNVATRLG
jgi:predicted methyltransferase MtxX (methanogen marker protein 4)